VSIRFVDDSGKEIITGDGTVSLSEPPAGVLEVESGAVLVFDVPFEHAGRYEFQIELDQDVKTVVPVTVSPGPPSPPFNSPSFGASGPM
jgi:hypothetical protein